MHNLLIEANTPETGSITLRTLTLGDFGFFEHLVKRDPPPRHFVVALLVHQIESTLFDVHTIQSWSDSTLQILVTIWLQNVLRGTFLVDAGDDPFEQAKTATRQYLEVSKQRLQELIRALGPTDKVLENVRQFASNIGQNIATTVGAAQTSLRVAEVLAAFGETQRQVVLRSLDGFQNFATAAALLVKNVGTAITAQLEQFSQTLQLTYQPVNFVARLPNIASIIKNWEDLYRATEALDATGYGFASNLITVEFARAFVHVPPRVRAAAVTNRMLGMTRGDHFFNSVMEVMEPSLMLKRRSPIVLRALEAHQARDYVVSIPLLLTQIEGTFADMMILKQHVIPKGNKLYVRAPMGGPKLDSRGKPIPLNGLGPLVNHANFTTHPAVQSLCDHLASAVIPARNGVLHGRNTSYARAKLSTELALLVFMLSTELTFFENADVIA